MSKSFRNQIGHTAKWFVYIPSRRIAKEMEVYPFHDMLWVQNPGMPFGLKWKGIARLTTSEPIFPYKNYLPILTIELK